MNLADEAPEISFTGNTTHQYGQSSKPSEMNKMKRRFSQFLVPSSGWDSIFVASCVIAVSLDPLFFYIPIIDREKKCLQADTQLRTATLILRSLMDITFVVHILYQIHEAMIAAALDKRRAGSEKSKFFYAILDNLPWRSLITDVLSVLPIPQVLLVVVFFKITGSGYLDHRKILNLFLLAQYLPRIYRIHLSSKILKKSHGVWIKGLFNFFIYIFASHVLGAFWYFFSIERETSCWHRHCGPDCPSTFYCDVNNKNSDDMGTLRASLNESCAIVTGGPFDFGIFFDSLKSNNTKSRNFPQKLCYSFWWGLRNLSNFGTNLVTSTYVWENLFAILISIISLLLFLYLIGNIQTYMQLATTKSEVIRQKMKIKDCDIQLWTSRYDLPDDMKTVIRENVRRKLEENKDVHVENLLPILPPKDRESLKRLLCMDALKKVPMLRYMDECVLQMICDNLQPVAYTKNTYVIRAGEPLDLMLFNIGGIILTYTATDGSVKLGSSITKCLSKGDFYGEELLSWASSYMSFSDLPISTKNVKCHTKVEAFSLMAKDLKTVVSKFWWRFSKELPYDQLEELALSSLRARRRNRPKKHIKTTSCLRLTIDKGAENSQKLEYQPLYPVVAPRSI